MPVGASVENLIDRAVAAAGGTQRKAAERLGITEGWFSHVKTGKEGAFDVEPCLLLADLVGERPQAVLRAFGHDVPADKLDKWFGANQPVPPPHPIVSGLAEALAEPAVDADDLALARMVVNRLRKRVGLPAIEEKSARRRARRR